MTLCVCVLLPGDHHSEDGSDSKASLVHMAGTWESVEAGQQQQDGSCFEFPSSVAGATLLEGCHVAQLMEGVCLIPEAECEFWQQ